MAALALAFGHVEMDLGITVPPGKGELQSQAAARERRAAPPGPVRPVAPTRRAGPHRAAPLSGDALSCQGLRPAYADSEPHCPSPQTSATTSPVTRGSRCLPTPGGGPSSSASESRWAWAQPGWRREDGALRPGTLPPPRRGTRARRAPRAAFSRSARPRFLPKTLGHLPFAGASGTGGEEECGGGSHVAARSPGDTDPRAERTERV